MYIYDFNWSMISNLFSSQTMELEVIHYYASTDDDMPYLLGQLLNPCAVPSLAIARRHTLTAYKKVEFLVIIKGVGFH